MAEQHVICFLSPKEDAKARSVVENRAFDHRRLVN